MKFAKNRTKIKYQGPFLLKNATVPRRRDLKIVQKSETIPAKILQMIRPERSLLDMAQTF